MWGLTAPRGFESRPFRQTMPLQGSTTVPANPRPSKSAWPTTCRWASLLVYTGTRASLQPGETLYAVVQQAADGSLSVSRVQVSKDGFKPAQ